ncbi:hypothetical protein C0991_006584 [Blastosporella zonata]|nr:hypothetical protein C0991_006584 [Blastosporella zonata]
MNAISDDVTTYPLALSPILTSWKQKFSSYMPGSFPGLDREGERIVPPTTINALPDEILVNIFFQALKFDTRPLERHEILAHGQPKDARLSFAPGSVDPTRLAQVCESWRVLVLEEPKFWSTIRMRCTDHQYQVPVISEWLRRSGSNPLSIYIENDKLQRNSGLVWSTEQLHVIASLTTTSHRWKDLRLRFSCSVPIPLDDLRGPGVFKILESVEFTRHPLDPLWYDSSSRSFRLWDVVHSSPVLSKVVWNHDALFAHLYNNTLAVLPWKKLTSVKIPTLSPSWTMGILSFCANMVELELECIHNQSLEPSDIVYSPQQRSEVHLPHLTTFAISGELNLLTVLDQLTLPSLTSFRLTCYHTPNEFGAWSISDSVNNLLNRSYSHLEKLYITCGGYFNQSNLIGLLYSHRLKDLVTLAVDCGDPDGSLVRVLTRRDIQPLLPKLEVLSISGSLTLPFEMSTMIWSRSCESQETLWTSSLLREVRIRSWSEHREDLRSLKVLGEKKPWMKIYASSMNSENESFE